MVLVFFGGAGLLLYGACGCWCPRTAPTGPPLDLDDRSRIVALIGVGVLAALLLVGDSWGGVLVPVAAGLLGLIVLLVVIAPQPGPTAAGVDTGPAGVRPAAAGAADRRPVADAVHRSLPPRPVRADGLRRRRRTRRRPRRRRRTRRPRPHPVPATRASAARSCSGSPSR